MKVMSLLLRERGMSLAKVAILVGGPDWPTSVLMGLMGLPLPPMIMGTLPVICLVAPLSLSGSFMIQGTIAPFPALTNIALALSSLSQVGTFVAMLHYVEQVTQTNREALETMPYDLEVLELDRRSEEYAALYAELTAWASPEVPRVLRVLLCIGAASGIGACQMATLRGSNCFRDFSLYPDFNTQLRDNLGGHVSNLIMLPGYGVLGLALIAYICRFIFTQWASSLVRKRFKSGQRSKAASRKTTPEPANGQARAPNAPPNGLTNGAIAAAGGVAAGGAAEPSVAACGVPGGGRKLSQKSKPFWELQRDREAAAATSKAELPARAATAAAATVAVADSERADPSSASKDRPGRHHHRKERSNTDTTGSVGTSQGDGQSQRRRRTSSGLRSDCAPAAAVASASQGTLEA